MNWRARSLWLLWLLNRMRATCGGNTLEGAMPSVNFSKFVCGSSLGIGGLASAGGIVLCRNPKFADRRIDNATVSSAIYHEIAHQYQFQLGGGDGASSGTAALRKFGPKWFREGSAYLIGETLEYSISVDEYRSQTESRLDGELINLATLETQNGLKQSGLPGYLVGILAAADLIPTGNYRRFIDFYESFGRTADWKDSFEMVFGRSVKTYYMEFLERPN